MESPATGPHRQTHALKTCIVINTAAKPPSQIVHRYGDKTRQGHSLSMSGGKSSDRSPPTDPRSQNVQCPQHGGEAAATDRSQIRSLYKGVAYTRGGGGYAHSKCYAGNAAVPAHITCGHSNPIKINSQRAPRLGLMCTRKTCVYLPRRNGGGGWGMKCKGDLTHLRFHTTWKSCVPQPPPFSFSHPPGPAYMIHPPHPLGGGGDDNLFQLGGPLGSNPFNLR